VLLRCIHEQWRTLHVFVNENGEIVRLRGKAPRESEDAGTSCQPVVRDDVWMAFSIGLQWCSRFTRILPTPQHRAQLVEYMRSMRGRVHEALRRCLGDAELGGTPEPVPPAPVLHPSPAIQPASELLDAITMFGCLTSATLSTCSRLRTVTRTVIMALAANGAQAHGGYLISARRVRRSAESSMRFWSERVARGVRKPGSIGIRALWDEMGTTSTTVRWSRSAGGRGAWPGLRNLPRGTTLVSVKLEDVSSRLQVLLAYAQRITDFHATDHPLLDTPETRGLLTLTLGKLATLLKVLQDEILAQYPADHPSIMMANSKRLTELAEACANRPLPAAPETAPLIPMALLSLNAQMAEEEVFLRRLLAFHRASACRLLPLVGNRWEVAGRPDVVPGPGLRGRTPRGSGSVERSAYAPDPS
jgi:hypothetical protein